MKTFRELGLSSKFVSMLKKERITTPSEIQEKTIPLVLAGRDVIGGSATGSGKTLAFASGIIENLKKNGKVQALILTPTRELADQVANAIAKFSKHRDLKVLPVYGGVNIENQIRLLRKTDVVVGTPGRILDHLSRRTLNLDEVKFLVLDEGDRMLDMGFQYDVEKILKKCPEDRQTTLFSATISSKMDNLTKRYTNDPVEVSVESHVDASKLKQFYYDVPDGLKFSLFVHLLKEEKSNLVLVFCATRRNVDFVASNLNNSGIKAKAIHGGMNQNKRNRVLGEFNSESGVNVLVCTDVAARGLDIRNVSHVYNYDLPKVSEDYIHRIGRTARAGKEGIAINILCSRDYDNFTSILRDEKLKIEKINLPQFEKVSIIVDSPDRQNTHRGSRGRGSGRDRNNHRSTNRRDTRRSESHGRDRPSSRRRDTRSRSESQDRTSSHGDDKRRRDYKRTSRRGSSQGYRKRR